jgi:arsenate reductase-like glutaredoxin family protein
MSQTVLYGLEKCSTCLKARAWLDEHGVKHKFVDYRDDPVPPATLRPGPNRSAVGKNW